MNKVPMTADGFAKLKEELRWRQQEERPTDHRGDLRGALAWRSVGECRVPLPPRKRRAINEGRVHELEDLIARAEVIDVSKLSGDKVKFGATVVLVDEDTEEKKTYQIVGDQEADVRSGRISISSPIARALIGKEVGEAVEVNAPGGARGYEIVKVSFG